MNSSDISRSVLPGIGPSVLLITLLMNWVILLYIHHRAPQQEAIGIDTGMRLIDASDNPPVEPDADWQAVHLTDDWWVTAPHERQIWYRFELDLEVAPDRLWAIYLPRAAVNARVWLNGETIGSGGRLHDPTTINWSRPLYLLVPNGLLRPGNNEIFIQLVSDLEGNGLLRKFYLGSDEDLATYFQWRYFIDVTAVEIITVFMCVISIFMGALWWMRRDPVYGWFSVMVMLWSLHHLALLVTYPPVAAELWWWFWYMAIGWAIICTVFFTHTVLELKKPLLERSIVTIGIAGSIILAIAAAYGGGYWLRLLGNHGWDSMVLVVGAYSIYRIYTGWHYEQQRDIRWLLTSGLLTFTFGARDWLVLNSFMPRDDGFYIQFSPPLVLAIFGWILLTRFVGALNTAEQLNLELEERIALRVDEVKQQHRQILFLEKQQVLAGERERLMRDMHDGIGGQLVSTLALIEGGHPGVDDIQQALQYALDDLRLVVNSLDPELEDLGIALGDLRFRLQPRLEAAGIQVDWHSHDLPDIHQLGPGRVLQILRIVQEAITNVIKHSACSWMSMAAQLHSDIEHSILVVTIEDNGQGFSDKQHHGKGIGNLHNRAQNLGAEISIESTEGITRVQLNLVLPLEPAATKPES